MGGISGELGGDERYDDAGEFGGCSSVRRTSSAVSSNVGRAPDEGCPPDAAVVLSMVSETLLPSCTAIPVSTVSLLICAS